MARISPHIRVNNGKCKEALDFYKQCFDGGEIKIMTLGQSPMAKDMPPEKHGLVMHGTFKKGDVSFSASDMMRDKVIIGDNVAISIDCDSEKEVNDLFSKLSAGGEVFMKPEKQFWGAFFGMTTDKYGVEWMLNYQFEPMKM